MSIALETYSLPKSKTETPTRQINMSFQPWRARNFITLAHIIGLAALFLYKPSWQSWVLAFLMFQVATLGITMGYHRLWSHKSYKAHPSLQIALAIAGTTAFQGSIKWWVVRHRLHHRYTDTEHDPYNAKRGFWYSHIGWLYITQKYPRIGWIDTRDLDENLVVKYQHKLYVPLAFVFGILMPALLGSLWGDFLGGFLYGGIISHIFIWHSTFLINSLAHALGEQDFSTENTSRGNWVLALLTHGEGHHNFHHEFPNDYRNGIHTMDWDPTKWSISLASKWGLAWDLRAVPDHVILSSKLATCKEALDSVYQSKSSSFENIPRPIPDSELPSWTREEFDTQVQIARENKQDLCLLDGYVLNLTDFKEIHPGGKQLLLRYVGKDATDAFYGQLNRHTKSARMMTRALCIAKAPWATPDTLLESKNK